MDTPSPLAPHVTDTSTRDIPRLPPEVTIAGPEALGCWTMTTPTSDRLSWELYTTADTLCPVNVAPTATGTGCESSISRPTRPPTHAMLACSPPAPLSPAKQACVSSAHVIVTSVTTAPCAPACCTPTAPGLPTAVRSRLTPANTLFMSTPSPCCEYNRTTGL